MTRDEKARILGELMTELQETTEASNYCAEQIMQTGDVLRQLGQSLGEFTCKGVTPLQERALDAARIKQLLAEYASLSAKTAALRKRKEQLGF